MITNETHKMAIRGERCLRKILFGQYVTINRDSKACRVSAKEALKMAKGK